MKKKGGTRIILLVIVIISALGIGGYFIFFRDSRAMSGYTYNIPDFNTQEICDYYDGYEGEICVKATDSIIYYGDGETNDVILFRITKGLSEHKSMLKSSCETGNNCDRLRNVFISSPDRLDRPTFSWYYSENKFLRIKQWGENIDAENSKVIESYLDKYPPIQI